MASRRRKANIAKAVAVVFFAAAIALAGYCWFLWNSANPSPNPTGKTESQEEEITEDESEFPYVDWDYWLDINSDIVAWLTVPGTGINHPVVQAHSDAPDYYLKHDIYRNYNPMGTLYLDADCEDAGIYTQNAVIMGHHWEGVDSIAAGGFSCIADYKDEGYASEHATVLIQTPTGVKLKYKVRFANIVPGWKPLKRCTFTDDADYAQWYEESLESAAMTLDGNTRPKSSISLVSCSYNYWSWNERTVLVTSKEQS